MSGNLFIIASPSGGGKTSLVKALINQMDNLEVSISHTTRAQKPGEEDGVDYFFIDEKQYHDMVAEDAFLESAKVFGYHYGTANQQIQSGLAAGKDIILDIDWQGAQQIRHLYPEVVTIFIIPPSLEVLKNRLKSRQRDDDKTISQRMQQAREEISHYIEFDYLVVNDDFDTAVEELRAIIISTGLKIHSQSEKQSKLLSFLLSCE